MNKGKIFVIEGSDGSGKGTQSELLFNVLKNRGFNVRKISFPNYNSDSSALVKMYLNGEFGNNPLDISPYAASSFYAVDRYSSYKKDWGKFYEDGGILIMDRYVQSNMIHQTVKIKNLKEKDLFLDWVWHYEFNLLGLPVPDKVLFLDVPPSISFSLMENRENKITGEAKKDIHESNFKFLADSYNNLNYLVSKYKWDVISCTHEGRMKSIEDIHTLILNTIKLDFKY